MATASRDPRPPTARQRALVVDDDAGVRELLRDVLELAHVDADLAASGDEALAALAHGAYDIVITEFRLPGPDGLAVAAAARGRFPTVPIIVITGAPERLDPRATDTPGIRVLCKPLPMTVLLVTVRELLAATPRCSSPDRAVPSQESRSTTARTCAPQLARARGHMPRAHW